VADGKTKVRSMTGNFTQLARTLLLVSVVALGWVALRPPQRPVQAQPAEAVAQVKDQALAAIRGGKIDAMTDLLARAAAGSDDPQLQKMADWARQFDQQRQTFLADRRKEFDRAAADVRKLLDNGKPAYAVAKLADAFTLTVDKEALRTEPWVVQLLAQARALAEEYDRAEDWIRALRIYAQLAAIEPDVAQWRDKLKTATRRVRLIALYAPAELKRIQTQDQKERDEVDRLLNPTTRPVAAQPDEEREIEKSDWRDTLRGARVSLLRQSIVDARENYWRTITYSQMIEGGIEALKTTITTPALEEVFPGLRNAPLRAQFLGALDAALAQARNARTAQEQRTLVDLIATLQRTNENTINLPEEVFAAEFSDGAFGALDPFSVIMWPQEWEEFTKDTQGEFTGVGIQIQVEEATGNLKVVTPIEDSPAYRAGFKPDWVITHIDGKSARWINVNDAVKRITGPAGTTVKLTVRKTDASVEDFTLTREVIKVGSVKGWMHKPGGGWDYMLDPDNRIAYIRLARFTRATSDDLRATLREITAAGGRGVILDLRYNPGGYLDQAVLVGDRFLSSGVIVSSRADRADSPHQPSSMDATRSPDDFAAPLVVLVNQSSASASEIVAGALKDHNRALIVGERTYGKGSVQLTMRLGPAAALKLTISHYYLPGGKCIHREENAKEWGVDPDILVEMTPDQARAALGARQEADILRDEGATRPAEQARKLLDVDPQLGAALLALRLQLAEG
jgi:carboxyl-terminal processing protease